MGAIEDAINNPPLTFQRLQEEHKEWQEHNFPLETGYQAILGATEELGELAHAHLKAEQQIRGSDAEHRKAKIDAVADIIIYLAGYCNLEGISFQSAVEKTWERVQRRDWVTDPSTGGENFPPQQSFPPLQQPPGSDEGPPQPPDAYHWKEPRA